MLAGRPGPSRLTFHVDDMDPLVAVLPGAGARPLPDPLVVRARGRRTGFWADPESRAVELADRRGDRPRPGRSN